MSHHGTNPTNWQTTTIFPDGRHLQVDCNSGGQRTIAHAICTCGQPVLIEYNARYTSRADRKRVFYADSPDNLSVFRCRWCHECVSNSVPGAEYAQQPNVEHGVGR